MTVTDIFSAAAVKINETRLWEILQTEIEAPKMYGPFHIVALLIIFTVTALLCYRYHSCDDRTYRRIMLICWIIITVLELLRQFLFNFDITADGWRYIWAQFPFQLCSTPLYVMPFIVFLPDGRVRDAMISYTITYAFFGGFAVLCYPGNVFIDALVVDVQTMISHGMQFVTGVFSAVFVYRKMTHKYFLGSIPIFLVGVAIAVALNHIPLDVIEKYGSGGYMDMFFLSPHEECEIPVLNLIQAAAPYAIFVAVYVVGSTGFAALMFYGQRTIIAFFKERKWQKSAESERIKEISAK